MITHPPLGASLEAGAILPHPMDGFIYNGVMNEYAFLFAIAGVLLVGAMSPGPSFLIVAQSSLSKSRMHGIATSFGTALGVAIFAVLASIGVTTLIEQVPNAFLIFKTVGGIYLLYLALLLWLGAKHPLLAEGDTAVGQEESQGSDKRGGLLGSFSIGLVTQISNPKTALVIAGIFAAFVPADPPQFTMQLVAVIAFVIDFCWYALVAVMLSGQRSKSVYISAKTGFDRTASIFLGLVGTRLLLSDVA